MRTGSANSKKENFLIPMATSLGQQSKKSTNAMNYLDAQSPIMELPFEEEKIPFMIDQEDHFA